MTDNIKVIVRVRPFNSNQTGQQNIVEMDGQQVRLKDPQSQELKKFAFHRCYWSTDESMGSKPVDNTFVFNDIGKEVLEHIYQGYNSTIFAYGQTGAGKSYSIEGYEEPGLLQMCLEDIFSRKEKIESQANGMAISVKITYLQIYNQKLRDLLDPKSDKQISIQSTGTAVFIKGVDAVHCNSYSEVQKLWKDGKKIRVIGAHAMNKNSSRSHAVFTIYYTETGKGKSMKSKFNIVDLAGSERQSKTQATGVRLQQANNINKSLTNLGIVIEALAKNCQKKTKDAFVPYRNSLLTHLLSQSLAGNSKTFMIAAISPAQSNFEETLSTLRFAQRASLISTQTKKNVQSKQGYNRELLEEIERLKKQLEDSKGKTLVEKSIEYIFDESKTKLMEDRMKKMLDELEMNKREVEELEKQLRKERERKEEMERNREKALKQAGLVAQTSVKPQDLKLPYLMNISEDPTLAGMLIYHLKQGTTSIGTKDEQENDIKLNSLGISKRHCSIVHEKNFIYIVPKNDARVFVNGELVGEKKLLSHLDRIVLGHANTFKLVVPGQAGKDDLRQSTIMAGKYGDYLDDRLSNGTAEAKSTKVFLQELEQRLPKAQFAKFIQKFKTFFMDIDQANDISMFRYKKFPIKSRYLHFRLNVVIDIQKYMKSSPELIILCENKATKQVQFVWTQDKFESRLAEMQDWYSDVSGKASESSYIEFDPWFDATDEFIKEKEKMETLKTKELFEFWEGKQKVNNEKYKECLKVQSDILKEFKPVGIDDLVLESYGDSVRRGQDVYVEEHIPKIQKIKENPEWLKRAQIYTDNVLQAVKCQQDNAFFNTMKEKYIHQRQNHHQASSKSLPQGNQTQKQLNKTIDQLSLQNVQLYQKIQELQYELKRKTHQLQKLK